jgi:hypothetical protein
VAGWANYGYHTSHSRLYLDLEKHGGRTCQGVAVRVAQRALTMGLDHHRPQPPPRLGSTPSWSTATTHRRAGLLPLLRPRASVTGPLVRVAGEVHHLLNVLPDRPARTSRHGLYWSAWRRRHQHRAGISHYQKRTEGEDHNLRLPH